MLLATVRQVLLRCCSSPKNAVESSWRGGATGRSVSVASANHSRLPRTCRRAVLPEDEIQRTQVVLTGLHGVEEVLTRREAGRHQPASGGSDR
jgi:hypothetical protein